MLVPVEQFAAGDQLEDEQDVRSRLIDLLQPNLHTTCDSDIRDASLTCAQKPTGVSLIYRTEPTTTKWKTHPFDGPLSETNQVNRYQKGKTSPDFTEARDSEWQ